MLAARWKSTCRVAAIIALLWVPQTALSQEQGGDAPPEQIRAGNEAEPGRAVGLRDEDFQRLSKKQQSELITLETYTDEEWETAVLAVKANLEACDKGDAAACKSAGDAYAFGDGVWPITKIAYILYKQACDAGVGAGCRAFVELAGTGYGYPEGGYQETDGLMEKACDLGDWAACTSIATEFRMSDTPADLASADAFLARSRAMSELACDSGDHEACYAFGRFLAESGRPEDLARATGMWDALCRKSVLAACQDMAALATDKPEPDHRLAGQYQHLACDLGSALDCTEMGARAYHGNGVAKDPDLALVYYDKACAIEAELCVISPSLRAIPQARSGCAANDARACAELGKALVTSLSSPEFNREQAMELLAASCRKGVGDACVNGAEAVATLDSRSDPARLALFNDLLETGCTAGDEASCFSLASALEEGKGGITDVERAVALFARLCDARFPDACARESRHTGFVPAARIAPAGDYYLPPQPEGALDNFRDYIVGEVCFTGSEDFRGQTYSEFQCDRGEKGIGSQPAQPGKAPWQALIWRPETLAGKRLSAGQRVLCGGSLIAPGWVLTAAHCLSDNGTKVGSSGHRIRLGVYNPQIDEGISYPILRAIPHPQYNRSNRLVFDIALIQYDHRAGQVGDDAGAEAPAGSGRNRIASITLDPLDVGQREIVTGTPVYSFGWGWTETENSRSTDYLQVVKMETLSESACTAFTKFSGTLSNAALCAGGKDSQQTCFGDSGGPLVYYGDASRRPVLIGVVSAGKKCGATGLPSQYTRVAKVRRWIESYIRASR